MEIENNRIATLVTTTNDQGAPVTPGPETALAVPAPPRSSANSADTVSFTDSATRLRELETELASRPVIDSERVGAVRDAVENGSFAVDPERIADKFLSLEQALTDSR